MKFVEIRNSFFYAKICLPHNATLFIFTEFSVANAKFPNKVSLFSK